MCSPDSRISEPYDSYQGKINKRRRCPHKERKSKSDKRAYLTLNSHSKDEGSSSSLPSRVIGEDGNPPANALHSLAVVFDEKQNDENHNGDSKRHEKSLSENGIIVYTRRLKKKAVEDGICKPSTDTSGLSSYTTDQSESAEKTDKSVEKYELNASMSVLQKHKESVPRPQGSKMSSQTMKTIDSIQFCSINRAEKLSLSRDTMQELVKSQESMQASNSRMNNLCLAAPPRSTETIKDKYARLRSRQKQRISLRHKNRAVFPGSRIRLDAGTTESVRVHTPQYCLKKPVLQLTNKSPLADHFHSCINSCLNFPILQDPRKVSSIQDNLAGKCCPWTSRGSNVASCLNLTRNASDQTQGTMTFWSGQELDSLWVGVRKYGQGNWENLLRDPSLCFSRFKNAQDLAVRWNFERLKILDGGGLTTLESDNFVSTDLRLNSLLPCKNRVHSKPVTRNHQVGGMNGICMGNKDLQLKVSEDEREFVKSEENGYSSEGTISE